MLLHWNDDWLFTPEFTPDLCEENYYGPPLQAVRLPHTVKPLPYNYCSEQDYQLVSGYRREFCAPEEWKGRRILLTFGAVAHEATVWCNGQQVAVHRCGYTAFTVDLTDLVCYGGKNVIAVRCDSRESLNQPPFGHVIDYLTYGGIYRGVTLEIKEQVWLQDVFVTAGADGAFRLYPTVAGEHIGYQLHARLYSPDGNTVGTYIGSADAPLGGALHQALQWHPDHPYLYTLRVQLRPCGGRNHPEVRLPHHSIPGRRPVPERPQAEAAWSGPSPVLGLPRIRHAGQPAKAGRLAAEKRTGLQRGAHQSLSAEPCLP